MNTKNKYKLSKNKDKNKIKDKTKKKRGFISNVKDLFGTQEASQELKECVPKRLKQTSGTCWFNAALNLIIYTPKLRNNMYKYLDSLPQEDKDIISTFNTYSKLDLEYEKDEDDNWIIPKYKLKHLLGGLFFLIKTTIKPDKNDKVVEDIASRVKSIGEYGKEYFLFFFTSDTEYDLTTEDQYLKENVKNPKLYGVGYDSFAAMIILIQYCNLINNNDFVITGRNGIIENYIDDEGKESKKLKLIVTKEELLEIDTLIYDSSKPLYDYYSLEAISFSKLAGLHVSTGLKCKTNNRYITYDSNDVIRYEDWFITQAHKIDVSVFVAKKLKK
jgi:hypothetical protein